jgi:hypothetical protein
VTRLHCEFPNRSGDLPKYRDLSIYIAAPEVAGAWASVADYHLFI